MQVITPCFLFMFHDSIIIWETGFNLFCVLLAITAVIITFCKLLLGFAGKSALLRYPHCHRFGFGPCMEPWQLSGIWAKCDFSKLVRAVCLCHCPWSWGSCLMPSNTGTSARDALAALSITQLISGTKLVKHSEVFFSFLCFEKQEKEHFRGRIGRGECYTDMLPAWCSPPAEKSWELLEIPGNTNPRALV